MLGTHQTETSVIWSLDKDLRQIPGYHLDDATQKVIEVTEVGRLEDRGKKVYFDGTIGFYYQLLIGDNTDHIVGCGKRVEKVYKSGEKKGQTYTARVGVGSKAALKLIMSAVMSCRGQLDLMLPVVLDSIIKEYASRFGDGWQEMLETQANLLYMVRYQDGEIIRRWTFDGREEYFDLVKGVIIHDYDPPTN